MGLENGYRDAHAREEWHAAFGLARRILNRKLSKRLMVEWIGRCLEALEASGMRHLLPAFFDDLSVYGQREELNKIEL